MRSAAKAVGLTLILIMCQIFIKAPGQSLDTFVRLVTDTCGIGEWEQGFSDNWPNGTYFISRAFGIVIQTMTADSVAFPDYDFWIIVSSNPPSRWDGNALLWLVMNLARNLAPYVTELARPIFSETLNQDATISRIDESGKYAVTQRMKSLPDLPHWRFEVAEVSAGVFEVVARSSAGRMFSKKGFDPDALIKDCTKEAREIGP